MLCPSLPTPVQQLSIYMVVVKIFHTPTTAMSHQWYSNGNGPTDRKIAGVLRRRLARRQCHEGSGKGSVHAT
jgi:hypothetical protein